MQKKYIESAAPEPGADHLTLAWLAFAAEPGSKKKLDRMAVEVERALRDIMGGQGFGGLLCGREEEILQEACLLLFLQGIPAARKARREGMLAGNKSLVSASARLDYHAAGNQIRRSMFAALRYARLRVSRTAFHELSKRENLTEQNGGFCQHPAHKTFAELPYAARREFALAALGAAVRKKLITENNSLLAALIFAHGFTRAQAAQWLGISRQAAHAHLRRVNENLPKVADELELPFV